MKNPIPKQFRLRYAGCKKQKKDARDILMSDITFTPDPLVPSWEQGFDVEKAYGIIRREHQGPSLSCVGQAWSKYLEIINLVEEKKFTDLSAKDIYSQIAVGSGGAYIRDGAKLAVGKGICEEEDISSYQDGNPPTEPFMRLKEQTDETRENALRYRSRYFIHLDIPLNIWKNPTDEGWENMRQIIWQYHGFVSGYKKHCMFCSAYGLKNGKKFIKFINSYGEGSDHIYTGYFNYRELYDATFVADLPNPPDKIFMLKLIKEKNKSAIYCLMDGEPYYIATMKILEAGKKEKIFTPKEEPVDYEIRPVGQINNFGFVE